jgi:hypothetical protein
MAVVLAAPLLEGWFTAVWTAEVLWLLPLLSSGASCFLFFVKKDAAADRKAAPTSGGEVAGACQPQPSDIQDRFKLRLAYRSVVARYLWVQPAYGTYVVVRQLLKRGSSRDATQRFAALLVVDVTADLADVLRRFPGLESPFPYRTFSGRTADRTYIVIRQVLKRGTFRDAAVGLPSQRGVDVVAVLAAVSFYLLHGHNVHLAGYLPAINGSSGGRKAAPADNLFHGPVQEAGRASNQHLRPWHRSMNFAKEL